MIAVHIRPEHIVRAWQDLGPILARAQRDDQPDARSLLQDGRAELWAVLDDAQPIGAAVTQVKPGGRLLFWQIAGERVREWSALLIDAVEAWARSMGCTALYGVGRRGWARIVEPLGFERVPDIDGRATWERRIA